MLNDSTITLALVSQYEAAFAMFRGAVAAMPPHKWNDPADANPAWRVAYHALYFTHLYLGASEAAFVPWERAMAEAESIGEPWVVPPDAPVRDGVYTSDDLLAYLDLIVGDLARLVPSIPFTAPSGFSWIRISRFEHHLRNIRHLQHHAGQLAERVRANAGGPLEWTGAGPSARLVEGAPLE